MFNISLHPKETCTNLFRTHIPSETKNAVNLQSLRPQGDIIQNDRHVGVRFCPLLVLIVFKCLPSVLQKDLIKTNVAWVAVFDEPGLFGITVNLSETLASGESLVRVDHEIVEILKTLQVDGPGSNLETDKPTAVNGSPKDRNKQSESHTKPFIASNASKEQKLPKKSSNETFEKTLTAKTVLASPRKGGDSINTQEGTIKNIKQATATEPGSSNSQKEPAKHDENVDTKTGQHSFKGSESSGSQKETVRHAPMDSGSKQGKSIEAVPKPSSQKSMAKSKSHPPPKTVKAKELSQTSEKMNNQAKKKEEAKAVKNTDPKLKKKK